MSKEYGYKTWRISRGRQKLENPVFEDCCKLQADGRSLEDIQKFVIVSKEDYETIQSDPKYQARLIRLKELRAEEDGKNLPETQQDLKKYAIKQLVFLSRRGLPKDNVKVSASKALFECAGEMESTAKKEEKVPDSLLKAIK